MISVNFSHALASYLILSLTLVFFMWIFYTWKEDRKKNQVNLNLDLFHCPYCSFVFYADPDKDTLACPRCHSLIKAEKNLNGKGD